MAADPTEPQTVVIELPTQFDPINDTLALVLPHGLTYTRVDRVPYVGSNDYAVTLSLDATRASVDGLRAVADAWAAFAPHVRTWDPFCDEIRDAAYDALTALAREEADDV
ncbi:MAG TPA: hypothetical protein VI341_13815 [Actinomycetota bacterium]